MSDEVVSVKDIFLILRRHWKAILLTILACEGIAQVMLKAAPRKYKAQALLNLQATYFEVPTVTDSIVGSRDYTEMQAQKTALMRLAINDTFLEAEGEKLGLVHGEPGSPQRIAEREGIRGAIDFFSSTTTTFQITAIGRTADISYALASDALDQIVSTLVNERQKNITSYRDSLRRQLEALGVVANTGESEATASNPQMLREELSRLEKALESQEARFNENHPSVIATKQKIQAVRQKLEATKGQTDTRPTMDAPLTIDTNKKGKRTEFGEELLRKINYLDVALEIERNKTNLPYLDILERPIRPTFFFFPKPSAFTLGGILAGILMAAIVVTFLELKRATAITPLSAAKQLGVPLLGSLPAMLETGRGPPERP
jgi:hypothetical protein